MKTTSRIAVVVLVLGLLSLFGCAQQADQAMLRAESVELDAAVVVELVARPDGAGDWIELRTSAGDVQRFVAVLPSATPVPPTETPEPPTVTPVPPTETPLPTDTPTATPEPPTATPIPSPTNTPLPTNTPTPEPTDTPEPTPTPEPAGSVLFGPFNWVPSDAWPFTISRLPVSYLALAEARGVKVLVSVSGKASFTDSSGCFSLPMWKTMFDGYVSRIEPYLDSGTVIGLYAMDEPHDWSCGPSGADLNAICEYVHEQLPGLPCGFNTMPSWLVSHGVTEVDFVFTQTNFGHAHTGAEWATWAAEQLATSNDWLPGVPVYLSVNAVTYAPTGAQIRDAAVALCQSGADASLFWAWTARDFTPMRAELEAAAAACAGVAQ